MIYISPNPQFELLEIQIFNLNLTGYGNHWQSIFYSELHDMLKNTFPANDFQEDILLQLYNKHIEMLTCYSRGQHEQARELIKKYILPLLSIVPTRRGKMLIQLAEANLYKPYPIKITGIKELLNKLI